MKAHRRTSTTVQRVLTPQGQAKCFFSIKHLWAQNPPNHNHQHDWRSKPEILYPNPGWNKNEKLTQISCNWKPWRGQQIECWRRWGAYRTMIDLESGRSERGKTHQFCKKSRGKKTTTEEINVAGKIFSQLPETITELQDWIRSQTELVILIVPEHISERGGSNHQHRKDMKPGKSSPGCKINPTTSGHWGACPGMKRGLGLEKSKPTWQKATPARGGGDAPSRKSCQDYQSCLSPLLSPCKL